MVWKLLLTLAVLGACGSNGQDITCSTNLDCKSVCGTCQTTTSPGVCVADTCTTSTTSGQVQACNTASGKCQKPCTTNKDCNSARCETSCDTTSTPPYFCLVKPDCNKPGYACNSNSYKCEKTCTSDEDCTSETKCEEGYPAGCGPTRDNGLRFCQPCPLGLNCFTSYQNKPPPKCQCATGYCELKCGKGNSCCSKDSTTCNCCVVGSSTCYGGMGKREDQSSSWARDIYLHMEKTVLSGTCQTICTEDSSVCGNCEECGTDPNNTAQKLCKPCSAIGKECISNACQCTTDSCGAYCSGTCDATTGSCTPAECVEGNTCKPNPGGSGGYSCQP